MVGEEKAFLVLMDSESFFVDCRFAIRKGDFIGECVGTEFIWLRRYPDHTFPTFKEGDIVVLRDTGERVDGLTYEATFWEEVKD